MAQQAWVDSIQTAWSHCRQDPEFAGQLAEAVGTSPLVAQVLLNRGLRDPELARAFLRPKLTDLSDPDELPDIAAATARLAAAVRGRESVVVYGDYDVDGITGTALLVRFLRAAGAHVIGRLPDRLTEGYGLNVPAVRRMVEEKADLLVTVDHGTSAVEEIRVATEAGMDVVVIDHHTPPEERPPANAIVNPLLHTREGDHPCGVGVAFKVVWALARELAGGPRVSRAHRTLLTEALALVALGTVADVVPLRGENRVLTAFGLKQLAVSEWVGLQALLSASGLSGKELTAGDIGFKLGPRINAAGRMGRAELALELLLTDDATRADEIARALNRENERRREIEREIFDRAVTLLLATYEPGFVGGLALGGTDWHAGVIGIVASRLVGRFHRPVALVAFDGETGRGSCRSIPGVHLYDALDRCADHLEGYGGHAMAAGFTIRADRFESFRGAFEVAVREALSPEDLVRSVPVDVTASLSSIDGAVVRDVERLAPFGEKNPRPVFATRGAGIAGRVRRLGKEGQHISFLVTDGRATHRAIGFRMGHLSPALEKASGSVDIAYTPGFDSWRGDGSLELELRDVVISP